MYIPVIYIYSPGFEISTLSPTTTTSFERGIRPGVTDDGLY